MRQKSLTPFCLTTALLLLAGCTDAPDGKGDDPATPSAEPVAIQEVLDLYPSGTDKEWAFTVPAGFTTGTLHLVIQGLESDGPATDGGWCLRYRTPTEQGLTGQCGGGATVSVEGASALSEEEVFHRGVAEMEPGDYWLHFTSDAQPARLLVDLQASP